VPDDGSWDALYSADNNLDYAKYANETPEDRIWRNGQYALSSTSVGAEIWYGTTASAWCYWPMLSMKTPPQLMNFETENQGCQLTAPAGQMPVAQIYTYNVETGESIHIGKDTIGNGEQYWKDAMEASFPATNADGDIIDKSVSFVFRGAGSFNNISFFAGSGQRSIRDIKNLYIDTLPKDQQKIELSKFPDNYDFDRDGNIGYNRIFLFNTDTNEYLGFSDFYYDTVRRFQTVSHPDGSEAIYWFGGPDQSGGQIGDSRNQMLRWVGTEKEPFKGGEFNNGFTIVSDESFEKFGVVGDFRRFEQKDESYFVSSSWYHPYGEPAAMLVTNEMPESGFSAQDPAVFTPVMRYTDYDPDEVAGHGSKFAANAFYGDYLYFGSYHQGTSSSYDKLMKEYCDKEGIESVCKLKEYNPEDTEAHKEFMMKSWRAMSLFRIKTKNLLKGEKATKKVDLLYGNKKDWVFVPTQSKGSDSYDGYKFELQKNNMKQKPKWGAEGFGHQGMVYTFTMVEHDDKLFLGSWNSTAGLFDIFENLDYNPNSHNTMYMNDNIVTVDPNGKEKMTQNNPSYFLYQSILEDAKINGYTEDEARSGWLMVFEDTKSPATIVDKTGFGNYCNNGVRNYEKINGELYLGTTSWCNLGDESGLEYYKYEGSNRK
jgi:hypothetical protein